MSRSTLTCEWQLVLECEWQLELECEDEPVEADLARKGRQRVSLRPAPAPAPAAPVAACLFAHKQAHYVRFHIETCKQCC